MKSFCKTGLGNPGGTIPFSRIAFRARSGDLGGATASKRKLSSEFAIKTYVDGATAGLDTLSIFATYRTILEANGSITAAQTAGKYGLNSGGAAIKSGAGSIYPLNNIILAAADYPPIAGVNPKLRIRAQLYTNDVAPTGNFTVGLYPITRPGTSGGAGVLIYSIGTVVTGSDGATFTTPVADGLLDAVGSDFTLPVDGQYILGVVTTGTIAASAHVHCSAQLQIHNA